MRIHQTLGLAFLMCTNTVFSQTVGSLVPDVPSKAPDYFCTWNIQGYVCNYVNGEEQRYAMNEANMFGEGSFQNWVSFLP